MPTFLDTIKDGVLSRHISHPFSPDEVYLYFTARGIFKLDGTPFTETDILSRLRRAATGQRLFRILSLEKFFWFPDLPVSDDTYMQRVLRILRMSMKKGTSH